MSTSEGFLSRWAKRKQESARADSRADGSEADTPESRANEDNQPSVICVEAIALPDPDAITPEELAALPPLDDIVNPAEFSQYLRKGVPLLLRNAAMRRMWMLDPAIRDYVDPALDYAYNWNIPGGVPGNGELAEGFDAKAAAEEFFSNRRGKISMSTGEFEEAEAEASEQTVADQTIVKQVATTDDAESELRDSDSLEEDRDEDGSNSTDPYATLVVRGGDETVSEREESLELQSLKRRHGRALPV